MGSLELGEYAVSADSATDSSAYMPAARRQLDKTFGLIERAADLLCVWGASSVAYLAYALLHVTAHPHYALNTVLLATLGFSVLFVLMLDRDGAYTRANSLLGIRETERVLRVSVQSFGIVFLIWLCLLQPFSLRTVGLTFVLVPLLLVAEKQVLFWVIRGLRARGYGLQNVLVYGAGFTGQCVFSALVRSPKLGLSPVAVIDDDDSRAGQQIYEYAYKRKRSATVIAGPLTREVLRDRVISLVVVAIPSISPARLRRITSEAKAVGATVACVPQVFHSVKTGLDYTDIDGVPIGSLGNANGKLGYEIGKRLFDLGGAICLLSLLAPVWAVIALLVRIDSKGPVLFRQTRVGRNGNPFTLYKFRSMHHYSPKYDFHPRNTDDPRITRIGRLLRRTSLDELPQLINVIKGDMSLVGPRPEMQFLVDRYSDTHRQRLRVAPGVTGMWQLSADRASLIHENIQYDLYYIRHRNLFLDWAILLHTAVFAMRGV